VVTRQARAINEEIGEFILRLLADGPRLSNEVHELVEQPQDQPPAIPRGRLARVPVALGEEGRREADTCPTSVWNALATRTMWLALKPLPSQGMIARPAAMRVFRYSSKKVKPPGRGYLSVVKRNRPGVMPLGT
jgi:hypothetical protein